MSLNVFKKVFDIHAPIKKSYISANQGSFMNKTLQEAVMTSSKLRNKVLKNKTQSDETSNKKQINYCVSLFGKEKKDSLKIKTLKTSPIIKIFGKV